MFSEDKAKSVSKASSDAELLKHAAANGTNVRHATGINKAATLTSLDNGHARHMSETAATTRATTAAKDDTMTSSAARTGGEDQKFLRVALPDGSTTMIYAKPNTTVRAAIAKLCERRNLDINMVDVYSQRTSKVSEVTCHLLLVQPMGVR